MWRNSTLDQKILDVDDRLKTAQILRNEGLFEDAKHTLRKLIAQFPDELRARSQLEEIQREELTLILKEVQTGQLKSRPKSRLTPPPRLHVEDSDSIIMKLNQDLNLGLVIAEKIPTIKINSDHTLSAQDRIDLGIAFIQMGLHHLAAENLRYALTLLQSLSGLDHQTHIISTLELLATAYVESGRGFDAILLLETALSDNALPSEKKIGLMYWMARAHEQVSQRELSLMWFDEVRKRDPEYRDVDYRMRALGLKPK